MNLYFRHIVPVFAVGYATHAVLVSWHHGENLWSVNNAAYLALAGTLYLLIPAALFLWTHRIRVEKRA